MLQAFFRRVLGLSPVSITPTFLVPSQYHSDIACPLSVSLPHRLSPVSITPTLLVPCQNHSHIDCPLSVSLRHCLSPVSITPTLLVPSQYHSHIAPFPIHPPTNELNKIQKNTRKSSIHNVAPICFGTGVPSSGSLVF